MNYYDLKGRSLQTPVSDDILPIKHIHLDILDLLSQANMTLSIDTLNKGYINIRFGKADSRGNFYKLYYIQYLEFKNELILYDAITSKFLLKTNVNKDEILEKVTTVLFTL